MAIRTKKRREEKKTQEVANVNQPRDGDIYKA